jgi:hypothetical protein
MSTPTKKDPKDTKVTATVSVNGGPPIPFDTADTKGTLPGALKAAGYGPRTKDVTETLRHDFTNAEFLVLGRKLAEANIAAEAAEAEKKSITATLKAKCEGCMAFVTQISSALSAGYEYRPVVCRVTLDRPDRGQKETRRIDTNEVVKTEAMTLAEMQACLPGIDDQQGD